MDKGLQVILVGHFHGAVGGIDPLNRQFQRLAASHRAHGRGGGVDSFGFHAGRGEEGVFGFLLEEGEISHEIYLFCGLTFTVAIL